jgi:predicted nucleic acid-binding protein
LIVVDASVVAPALGDDTDEGDRYRARLRGESLAAPELVDPEVVSVLRRRHADGHLDERRAAQALSDLVDLRLRRVSHRFLLRRCWELRDDLTIYDATYVALAELLRVPLVTADRRLSHAPGVRCSVEVLA